MNFSVILSSTTYSLKVTVIRSPLKFLVAGSGTLLTITGTSLSLNPPEGELIFAQALTSMITVEIRMKQARRLLCINLYCYL
jgi:hypothetical protein